MGRKKVIDRDHVLDIAEQIVASKGASRLTIDAVAQAAGITKGGVQSCFSSKEAMIEAMLRRWSEGYDAAFAREVANTDDPLDRVRGHVDVTRKMEDGANARAASLLSLLLQSPEHLAWLRTWYRERIGGLDAATSEGRNARMAFLAIEGAFFLRFFGLMDLDQQWDSIGEDIARLSGAK